MQRGVRLETQNWIEAQKAFAADPVVLFPLGADAREHDPYLPLNNDALIASRAVDDGAEGEGPFSRVRGRGNWSESGVYGQATLATAQKGRVIAQVLVEHCLAQIEGLDSA